MSEIDLDHLQRWVGREQASTDPMPAFKAQALAAALDRDVLPQAGDPLPPAWQWLYFVGTPRASETDADGHPKKTGGFLPPVPLPRRMWAAGEFHMAAPLRLGKSATMRSTVASVEHKHGKTGELVFVNVENKVSQDGQVCITETQDLVYRAMPSGPTPLPPGEPAPEDADWVRPFEPNPVTLFRYSALTYNGHRIHYDRDYATKREHYPALLVHGPLLATLLAEATAIELPGTRIASFRFRAKRPTFDTDRLRLCGRREGDDLTLWTADAAGTLGMTATARLAGEGT